LNFDKVIVGNWDMKGHSGQGRLRLEPLKVVSKAAFDSESCSESGL
jgi:hypothetical protein